MKEIMDTSLVEGYIFLFEVLDMVGKECQHVFLAVIGLLSQCLVGQCADAAVALKRALAYLEQHTQVLIVEKADAFREGGLSFLRLHRQQQFVLTVEPFHQDVYKRQVVDIVDRETGEIIPSYISIDRKTNEITDIRCV